MEEKITWEVSRSWCKSWGDCTISLELPEEWNEAWRFKHLLKRSKLVGQKTTIKSKLAAKRYHNNFLAQTIRVCQHFNRLQIQK